MTLKWTAVDSFTVFQFYALFDALFHTLFLNDDVAFLGF